MRKDLIAPVIILCLSLYGIYFGLTETLKLPASQFPEISAQNVALEGPNGPVNLSDFNGKVSMVFFGYTHCPDVCPATLVNMSAALDELNDDENQAVQAIFISLDPQRDSPSQSDAYAKHFDRRILGLSGTPEQIEKAKEAFAVGSVVDAKKGKDDKKYTISHSTYIFIVRPDGSIGHLMGHLDSPSAIATKARSWLRWAD